MIESLRNYNPNDLIFMDIETRAQYSKEQDLPPEMLNVVNYYTRYRKEYQGETAEEFYHQRSPLFAEMGAIACASFGYIHDDGLRIKTFAGEDEREMLLEVKEFLDLLSSTKVFCHFAGIGFDEPFIVLRMWANGIYEIPAILDQSNKKPWEVSSLDLKDKTRLNRFATSSLLSLSNMLGLPSPKDAIDGSQVNEAFWAGRLDEIVEYCEKDVLTTCNIFLKITGRETIERSKYGQEKLMEVFMREGCIQKKYIPHVKLIAKDMSKEEKKVFLDLLISATLENVPDVIVKQLN